MRFAPVLVPTLALAVLAAVPAGAEELTVHSRRIDDLKAVFATVESVHETQARARLGGTVAELSVDEGQRVQAGQRLATVSDTKLALQMGGVDARVRALEAERTLAKSEADRAADLFSKGAATKARVDDTRTKLEVAERAITATRAERNVIAERSGEGAILAPTNGRVLKVHVTQGSVIMPGEPLATIAVEDYILRLALPERHARFVKVGDTVQVGARALSLEDRVPRPGTIRKVYPRVEDGRVLADVTVADLGDFFVGERVPVHVATGAREAFVVPRAAVFRRFGLDYLRMKDGAEVVVQLGQATADGGVEVLSGLRDGDMVVW
jgi:RND family efflux transporter MFP subunit